MTKFLCKIDMDNDAFADDPVRELRGLLVDIIGRLQRDDTDGTVMDTNGNSVGSWSIG